MGQAHARRPVVLVVEDEFMLRCDVMDTLDQAGFEVLEARNADEAIEILEKRNDVAILFTDIQMPGSMDGLRLATAVRNRWPPVKIVATSGHFKNAEGLLPEGGRFVPKPYNPARIVEVLRETVS